MTKVPPIVRNSFTGGVKTAVDPSAVPDGAIWSARNVDTDVSGILRLRRGTVPFFNSLGTGLVQGAVEAFNGMVMAWKKAAYTVNDSGVGTALAGTISANATDLVDFIHWTRSGSEVVYAHAGNGVYLVDPVLGTTLITPYAPISGEQVNLMRKTDGTQDLASGPAKCTIAYLRAALGQRIVIAGNPSSPNTVYFSAPLDATYYPANQVLQLPDDGGKVVGFLTYYETLLIFRDRDLWAFNGSDVTDASAKLYRITTAPGCVHRRTIVDVPNLGVVYLGSDNVYQLDHTWGVEDGIRANQIGDDIRLNLMQSMKDGTGYACATYTNREYRISLPQTLQQESVFRLNLLNGAAWFMDTGPRTSAFVTRKGSLYSASYQNGQIDKFDDTALTDNENGIPFYCAFRRENLQPGPARIKKFYMYAMAKGRTATQTVQSFGAPFGSKQFDMTYSETGTITTGTDQSLSVTLVIDGKDFVIENFNVTVGKAQNLSISNMEPIWIYEASFQPHLFGNMVEVRISANTVGEDITIFGYGIEYSPRGRIHGRKDGVTL